MCIRDRHCADAGANGFVSKKEGMNNIIAAIEAAKNGYCYFPFSLNRFVGSLTSDQQKIDSLSKPEISVMRYIIDGKDNNDIAEKMFISNNNVSTYKSRLMEKLECKSLKMCIRDRCWPDRTGCSGRPCAPVSFCAVSGKSIS